MEKGVDCTSKDILYGLKTGKEDISVLTLGTFLLTITLLHNPTLVIKPNSNASKPLTSHISLSVVLDMKLFPIGP